MARQRLFKTWCALLAASLIGVMICTYWLDIPVALFFFTNTHSFTKLGAGLGSAVLVAGQMALVIGLAITRMVRGALPEFAKALFVACCASLSAFVANDHVLKLVFGRQTPAMLSQGIPTHIFNFFQGDQYSSFPSGHMVMGTAFAVAMIRLQPRTLPFLATLLFIGAATLIVGDWHFIGDIIAGAFVGGTAGFVAGELWREHVQCHGLT
jgi:membrane-associated phospholipid phosphatase